MSDAGLLIVVAALSGCLVFVLAENRRLRRSLAVLEQRCRNQAGTIADLAARPYGRRP